MSDRTSRYPLAVEAPVLRMVNVLVPGVSTLSESARHYALYWALAHLCGTADYDASMCRTIVRRAESALAWASLLNPETGELTGLATMHGADTVRRLLGQAPSDQVSDLLPDAYSPRASGYWSQYKGPAMTLGIASSDKNALRPGRRPCPPQLLDMFAPLFAIIARRPVQAAHLSDLVPLASPALDAPDIEPLRALMTATPDPRDTDRWTGDDLTRRSTLRIFARAVQLQAGQKNWRAINSAAVAFGPFLDTDSVYVQEARRAQAWRGLLLRHHFVGAWRILWAALVDHVLAVDDPVDRAQLHEWIRAQLPPLTMTEFLTGLPATVDAGGHPAPAEDLVATQDRGKIESALAVLLLGSQRINELDGQALASFRGGPNAPRQAFLDPNWVGARVREHTQQGLQDFGAAVVDDMLAQSHRIALRKLVVKSDGRVEMPSKLYEREGRYFAVSTEGAYNIGYRAETLGSIATQLGLIVDMDGALQVTDTGRQLLELPE
jgi:hypothetical protein